MIKENNMCEREVGKKTFKCIGCGECCGLVPVTEQELKQIREKVKKMAWYEIKRLRQQKRDPFTCIFRDEEKNKCSIYEVRPLICQMFGFYREMVCPHNPEHAVLDHREGMKKIFNNGKPIGILGFTFTWDDILKE